jgi:Respiratory-chain NADH dehydrogenase, 49 Kd subunit
VGLRAAAERVAARAPVPVFAVAGAGAQARVDDLLLQPRLHLVDSPAAANVLLVAGSVPAHLATELARLHDGLSRPRVSVWWSLGSGAAPPVRSGVEVHDADPSVLVDAVVDTHRRLLVCELTSGPPLLPDEEPAPWRGVGPYGQGGTGMTGGVPYGRPMAEVAPDRDGLRLDQLTVRIGPFFARFPTGLVLEVRLQGDVVQQAQVVVAPEGEAAVEVDVPTAFRDALDIPVPVSVLELERARSHLRSIASALVAHQLPSLARRVLRFASNVHPDQGEDVERLHRLLRRSQLLGWAAKGVGPISADQLEGTATGPVARASGVEQDERTTDPAYLGLGFEPIVHDGGDARARIVQRLAETGQALQLAGRAGDRHHDPESPLESPRGRLAVGDLPAQRLLRLLPAVLEGMEWGDAVSTVVSLDLDTDEVLSLRSPDRELPVS